MATTGAAGGAVDLDFYFYDESSGLLADPAALTLDITFGGVVGIVADVAGPFPWTGATAPAAATVWRVSTGHFRFTWSVPYGVETGVYVANWTATYGTVPWLGTENFWISAGFTPAVPAGDVGFWTGSIVYTPPPGSTVAYSPVTVPLGSVDSNGIAWLLQKVDGWDSPDVQGAGVIPLAGDHGGTPSPQFYAPRIITLTIAATAPTQALRDLARSILQAAIPVSDLTLWTYDEPVPKQAYARRSGRITETYLDLCSVVAVCAMVAPDPRKYGTQLHSAQVNSFPSSLTGITVPFTVPFTLPAQPPSGALQAVNAGSFETRPVITITGPVTAPALQNVNTGQQVTWSGLTLSATDVLVADFLAEQSFVNGTYYPADPGSSWWKMPAGATTIQLTGNTGTGCGMTVAWSDAWM